MALEDGRRDRRRPDRRPSGCWLALGVSAVTAVALLVVPFLPERSAVRR